MFIHIYIYIYIYVCIYVRFHPGRVLLRIPVLTAVTNLTEPPRVASGRATTDIGRPPRDFFSREPPRVKSSGESDPRHGTPTMAHSQLPDIRYLV